jgi:cytochrome c
MTKPILNRALISAAVPALLLGLAACSGGSNETTSSETTATPATTETAAPAPAAAPEPAAAGPVEYASLTGDAAAGEKTFLQCKACHVLEEGVNRVGPSLHGIIGRTAGSVAGYNYSAANKNSGITWSEEELFRYLEAPQKVVPGTKMAFAGLKKPQDRANVIAYLKTASQ